MSIPANGNASANGAQGTDPTGQGASPPNQAGASAPDASGRSASSAVFPQAQEPASEPVVVDLIREMFRPRVRAEDPNGQEPAKAGEGEQPGQTGKEPGAPGTGTEQAQPFRVFHSPDDFQREISRAAQAEVDRREAKRAQDAERARRRELRDKDPYEYAKLDREEEAKAEASGAITTQAVSFANEKVTEYDRQVLDPLILAVKDRTRVDQVISTAPEGGIENRAHIARGVIDLIRQEALAEARRTLENDDSFVKQILARRGGQRAEPEIVPAVGAAPRRAENPDDGMNDYIRGFVRG